MSEKKPYFRLSPELSDGAHWTLGGDFDAHGIECVLDAVRGWLEAAVENGDVDGPAVIEVVELTDEEVEALPDV